MRSHIEFYPDGWEWRDPRQLRKRLVMGVGNNDADYATTLQINGKQLRCPAYTTWDNILERCYSVKLHQRKPSYVDVTCIRSWLRFSTFRGWYFRRRENIRSFGYEGPLHLDKDILDDSKVYGPANCLLVTPDLNNLVLDNRSGRGRYSIGVSKRRGKFRASVSIGGKTKERSGFNTPEEAAACRLQMKLEYVSNYQMPPWLNESIVRPRLLEIVRNQK